MVAIIAYIVTQLCIGGKHLNVFRLHIIKMRTERGGGLEPRLPMPLNEEAHTAKEAHALRWSINKAWPLIGYLG